MTREEQISNGFTEMMKGFWENQDLKVPDFEEPCKQEPCEDKRLYIKVFADLEPDDIAEKIYQICDEDKFPKVIESLKEYFDSEPCEDCVSREAVKDILHKSKQKAIITFEDFEGLVNKLPSVTPQPKIGHWQKISADKYSEHVIQAWDKVKEDIKGIATFDNLDTVVEVMRIIDKHLQEIESEEKS